MPGDSPRRPPVPQGPMRMGLGSAHRAASLEPEPVTTLGAGGDLASVAAGLDARTLVLSHFEPALGVLDVKDKKGHVLRLQHHKGVDCQVAPVVGRDKPKMVLLPLNAAKQLVPAVAEAVDRGVAEARWAEHADAMRTWVRTLAAASEVSLAGNAWLVSSREFQDAQSKVAFSAQHGWKGFSNTPTVAAPPARPTTAADLKPTGRLRQVCPGWDAATLTIADGHAARGFLLMADGHRRELSLQQTKFSLPPQFSVEFNAPGREPDRQPVDAVLARELSELIAVLVETQDLGPVGKVATQLSRALLKVM